MAIEPDDASKRDGAAAAAAAIDEAIALALEQKLQHVLDPGIRRKLVREQLLAGGPEEGFSLLSLAMGLPPRRGPTLEVLRDCLLAFLGARELEGEPVDEAGYELRRGIYECAMRAGAEEVARLLRSQPAIQQLEVPAARLPRDVADIPLGRRRSLAKGDDSLLLEKLALDPDSTVIANLLRNPRLTEQDVLRIAALRPVAASTLVEVSRSTRWASRPAIRSALARNPFSPVEVAVHMMSRMTLPDLRAMVNDPDLHPTTHGQVESEIARRLRGGAARRD